MLLTPWRCPIITPNSRVEGLESGPKTVDVEVTAQRQTLEEEEQGVLGTDGGMGRAQMGKLGRTSSHVKQLASIPTIWAGPLWKMPPEDLLRWYLCILEEAAVHEKEEFPKLAWTGHHLRNVGHQCHHHCRVSQQRAWSALGETRRIFRLEPPSPSLCFCPPHSPQV